MHDPADDLEFDLANELGDKADAADELIEGVLTRESLSVLYGDSNTGKTFFTLDMACAISHNSEWMGRRNENGLVVYLAAEGPRSVRTRLRAYQKYHGVELPNFAVVKSPIDLFNGVADVDAVCALVRRLEEGLGVKCELVIGDTLARLSAGANENSGEDMGVVLRNIDLIRESCRAHFLLIHHSGKDAARGMRGWSGLRAAVDTEIEVTGDSFTGLRTAEITKQRDLASKGERIGFRLESVDMGTSKWGKPITSCVVLGSTPLPKASPAKRPSEIAGAITELLTSHGAGMRKKAMVEHFENRYQSGSVYREIKKMVEDRRLHEVAGIVALVSPQ